MLKHKIHILFPMSTWNQVTLKGRDGEPIYISL